MFCVADRMIGVFNVEGELFALANECPHAGASLAHGELRGDTIACRIHHWRFRVCDGKYLDENEPRWDAQAFQLQAVEQDLFVDLPAQESDSEGRDI